MQGDTVKALRIIAENKGWNPSQLDGKPIEVGLTIRRPDGPGDVSLSPFTGPPGDSNPDNPKLGEQVSWERPSPIGDNMDRRTEGANPYPEKPL